MNKTELIQLLQKHLKVDLDNIPPSTAIRDLNIDSLDFMEILMDVEEEHGVSFTNDELLSMKTLDDLYSVLSKKL